MKTLVRTLPLILASLVVIGMTASPAQAESKSFTISTASPATVATGIVLKNGQSVKIEVSGDGKCGAGDDCPAGNPNGSGTTCAARALGSLEPGPAPALAFGAVAAQIGSEPPFATGASKTATGQGELVFFYNDCIKYYGDNTGSFTAKVTVNPKVFGHAYAMECGETSCQQGAFPGQKILVQGKAEDGTTIDTSAVTDAAGEWSVNVPAGTYLAGPTIDGTTIEGPGWDPEKSDPIAVGTADVPGIDFRTCAASRGGAASSASASISRAVFGASPFMTTALASSSGTYDYLCHATYTFQVKADIPQKTFVDPAPLAPYATQVDGSGFRADNQDRGAWFGQLPECERFDSERHKPKPLKWLSYYEGDTKLGTATLSLDYYRTLNEVTQVGKPKIAAGSLTRVYKLSAGKDCRITREVTPLVFASTSTQGRFQIVVSWPMPFLPQGYQPPPDLNKLPGAANGLHHLVEHAAEHIPGWDKLSEHKRLAIVYVTAELLEEGGHHLLKHAPSQEEVLKLLESTIAIEKATNVGVLLYNFAGATARSAEGYHAPTLAIRGQLRGYACDKIKESAYDGCTITVLSADVSTDDFPDFHVSVLRSGKGGGFKALPSQTIPSSVVVASGNDAGPLPGDRKSDIPPSKGHTAYMNELWKAMKGPVAPDAGAVAGGSGLSGVPKKLPDCDVSKGTLFVTPATTYTRCFGFNDGLP
jgi:hypothetical protein